MSTKEDYLKIILFSYLLVINVLINIENISELKNPDS